MDIMKTSLLVLFTFLCFNIYAQKPSHEVILKSGKKIRIEVVTKNSKKVTYWDDNGKRALILMSDIESISPLSGEHASKIKVDKVDDMTGNTVKRTYWDKLVMAIDYTYYFQLSRINENYYLGLKVLLGSVSSVDKGDKLILKLENGELVNLYCMEYSISCRGCGAIGISGSEMQGIEVDFILTEEVINKLGSKRIIKLRLYTSQGYIENQVKEKNADDFIRSLKALDG